jgi:O-antigen biosynthesis protein WbqV
VIQSAALSNGDGRGGGEVFLLDMGEPIRILDLARRFLRCHGLEPDVDVAVRITGARPGEKLFEELAYDSEDMLPTRHAAVHMWRTAPPAGKHIEQVIATFDRLREPADAGGPRWSRATQQSLLAALHAAVPEMRRSSLRAVAG